MGLLSPAALWLLIPALALVIALYLLRIRRAEALVPSTLLWQRITADTQGNRPWQRLRPSLLLVLQILALAVAAVAVARPFLRGTGFQGNDLVVIIDNSASMGASTGRETRLDIAKKEALELARSLGRKDRMQVIAASARTRAVTSATSDKSTLAAAIRSIPQTHLASNMSDALSLAAAGRRNSTSLKVLILSDGSFPELPEEAHPDIKALHIPIGTSASNVAITSVRIGQTADAERTAFIRVENTDQRPRRAVLKVDVDGRLIDTREIAVNKESPAAVSVGIPSVPGLLRATITPYDAFAADNTAFAILGRPEKASALIVGPGNVFLEQALALDERIQVTKAASSPSPEKLAEFEVVVWDRVPGVPGTRSAQWFIASDSADAPAGLGSHHKSETVLWRRGEDVARSADLSEMSYASFQALEVRSRARTLADAGPYTVIAAGESSGRRTISFGWNLLDSDLPLRPAFPILVANVVGYLLPEAQAKQAVLPGQAVALDNAGETSPIQIIFPDGTTRRLPSNHTHFSDTDVAGHYKWQQGSKRGAFAVNLASARESDLTVSPSRASSAIQTSTPGHLPHTNKDIYYLFIAGLLALLSIEWLLFHRRI